MNKETLAALIIGAAAVLYSQFASANPSPTKGSANAMTGGSPARANTSLNPNNIVAVISTGAKVGVPTNPALKGFADSSEVIISTQGIYGKGVVSNTISPAPIVGYTPSAGSAQANWNATNQIDAATGKPIKGY